METLIIYLAKASALLAVFLLAYYTLLRKETFFNTNRWYLLAGLATSALLPLVTYTKTVWVNPTPVTQQYTMQLHKLIALQPAQAVADEQELMINWFDVAAGIYLAGVLFFIIRFLLDIRLLRKLITGRPVSRSGPFLLVDSPGIKSPFSFFNYIVYNSSALPPEELESIINHEKVHSSQKHSIDMIIGQLFCIVFWFNPMAWLYKKSISQNLEFIADAEATKLITDKQAYQKTLLKITMQPECIAITNHFYQSLIKKRIVMLNKQQSKKRNSWKYTIVLPALAAFMLLFQVRTVAQEKEGGISKITNEKIKMSMEVNKDSKDEELNAQKDLFKEEFNTDVNFESIKRNQNKEITAIKVTVKDKQQSQVYEVAGNSPISPFTIEVEKDSLGKNDISFGTGNSNFHLSANDIAVLSEDLRSGFNDSIRSKRHRIIRSYELGDVPPPAMSGTATEFGSGTVNIDNGDFLVVIDGVKKGKGEKALKRLNSDEIASISIIKGKEAKKKYGKEGKKGVIEITTKKGIGFYMRSPQRYHIEIPEMPNGEAFGFHFEIPEISELPEMEGFRFNFGDSDINKMFIDGDVKLEYSKDLSEEDKQKLREEMGKLKERMGKVNADIQKRFSEMDNNKLWEGQQFRRADGEESRKEMEEARKELEKAKKELEEARKELQKTRANLDKKV